MTLPSQLLVAPDALGRSIHAQVDSDSFEIIFPAIESPLPEGLHGLVTPRADLVEVSELGTQAGWGHGGFLGAEGEVRPLASWVNSVVVLVQTETADASQAFYDLARDIGSRFNAWFEIFALWIELWTPQLLPTKSVDSQGIRGQVWEVTAGHRDLTGWGLQFGPVAIHWSKDAASLEVVSAAARRASKKELPPPEWQLLSRAAHLRDPHLAVIDSASAAEVALAHAVHNRMQSLPEGTREQVVRSANGLVGMVRLIESIDEIAPGESRWKSVADRLANPRNDAAHRGIAPSGKAVGLAMKEARFLLETYAPHPLPTDDLSG